MVRRCAVCKQRARDDDATCKNAVCSAYRPDQRGDHWIHKRKNAFLGPAAAKAGAFVAGGFAFSLQHRHDIRTGIASGMYLKHFVCDASIRMEILAVLYLCYWRWSTRSVLRFITQPPARMEELLHADSNRRADILLAAINEMEAAFGPYQVVGFREERRVDLLLRSESKRLGGGSAGCFRYHPYSNPASRRTGAQEFRILLPDIRSGNLRRACEDLAQAWRGGASGAHSKPTYAASEKVLLRHGIKLWRRSQYGRVRCGTLRYTSRSEIS